jgi:hypothetical protein
MATKNTKKASSHTVVSRALISAANRFLAKYDFADKKIAAPIGALLMTESTQHPFYVFCGNWFVGLASRFVGKSYAKKLILKVSSTSFFADWRRKQEARRLRAADL